jgi:glyoxylase-like metal-dependent hydrolase (beta-lactamase superfamily II)
VLLDTVGREALEFAKEQNRDLANIEIVLPEVTFEHGTLSLRVEDRTLRMISLPGHSEDGMGVLIVEDRVLFSGDVMMPIPYLLDGDHDTMVKSLRRIPKLKLENLVQGHGEVILRGEVPVVVKSNVAYIDQVVKHARKALRRKDPEGFLSTLDLESTGKSRILLNGLAEELHRRNLLALYERMRAEREG